MIVNSNRLRRAIERPSRAPQKNDVMEKRRMRDQVNRPLFFLLGLSAIMNLNTSLLTSIVFHCDNFANKCSLAYTIGLFLSSIITTFFLPLDFFSLIIAMLALTITQAILVLIGLFGEGLLARNLFISIFFINGTIEIFIVQSDNCMIMVASYNMMDAYNSHLTGVLMLTEPLPSPSLLSSAREMVVTRIYCGVCDIFLHLSFILFFIATYVSSKVLLDSSYSLIFVGFSSAKIILAALQGILEKVIGIDTIYRARLSLVLCHLFHNVITVIATFWTISLYIDFTSDSTPSNGAKASKEVSDKFGLRMMSIPHYFKLFYAKLILLLLSMGTSLSFFPCLIPFSLNMPRGSMLFVSTCCTISDFIGRTIGSGIDKEVDARTKSPEESHELFIFYGDLKYMFLFAASFAISLSIIILSWYNHYLATTPAIVFCIAIVVSFNCGVTLTRTFNGITAVTNYYIKLDKGKDDNERRIPENIAKSENTFQDISVFILYIGIMLLSILSEIVSTRITKRRSSKDYLIIANPGDLSEATVNTILGL